MKEVRKAAKKAKVFETQKLVKKLKGLRLVSIVWFALTHQMPHFRRKDEKSEDVAEAEAQLVALKVGFDYPSEFDFQILGISYVTGNGPRNNCEHCA